jgi:Immunoglobulin domain
MMYRSLPSHFPSNSKVVIRNNSLLACVVLTAMMAAQVSSAQLVTNTVTLRNTKGMGVGIVYGTPTFSTSYDKPSIRCDQTTGANKMWLGWDLAGVWAQYGKANLVDAFLTLWGENGTGRSFWVAPLNDGTGLDGWGQTSITWNNAPGNSATQTYPGSAALNAALDWSKCHNGTNLWEVSGGNNALTADLSRPDLGTGFDQCARYICTNTAVNSNLVAWLKTDSDGWVTLMASSPSGNQNWWVGTNGYYANDISLGYTSTNTSNGTFGDVIRDSPTLKLTFVVPAVASAPAFTNIMRVGDNIVLQGSNGVPQGAYQILGSGNVTQPLVGWSGVGIKSFDANGNFSFTNAAPAESASFYRLQTLSTGPVYPPEITGQPQSLTVAVGQDTQFNVAASGTDLIYRWYFNTNNLLAGGSGSSYSINNAQIADSGKYSVTVSNLLGMTASTFATLTVTGVPPAITVQPANQTVTVGQTANFSVTATGTGPLSYQWYYNTNTMLTDETNSSLALLNVNTNQAGKYSVTVTNLYGSAASTFATLAVSNAPLAFPEAEGYGKYATGGRGGAVYEVTTLNPTGTGSFGAAISATGARIVVFRVAGTITGNFNINRDNITIAGQTAPGDGICIKGSLSVSANNVIIRYLRVRLDTATSPESDTVGARGYQNIILDHVSASWSGDEVMSFYQNSNVTLQWCMITEACAKFIGGTNTGHQFGGIWGNNFGTYHHNLIAHNVSRNPRWASGCKYNDYRNNVIYNWDYESCYGGEAVQPGAEATWNFSTINMVANYYKYGPATDSGVRSRIANPSARDSNDKGSWFVAENHVNGYPTVTANNWLGVAGSDYIKLNEPWPAMPINQQTAEDAYTDVLAKVGCFKPNRDSVDAQIIQDVATGTAAWGDNGILTYPTDAGGGWPTLATGTPPTDTDHDGMPDAWETAHSLNPNNAADRNSYTLSPVYTNLEVYLNELGAF